MTSLVQLEKGAPFLISEYSSDVKLFDVDGAPWCVFDSMLQSSYLSGLSSFAIRHSQGCDTGAASTSGAGGGIDPARGPGAGGAWS